MPRLLKIKQFAFVFLSLLLLLFCFFVLFGRKSRIEKAINEKQHTMFIFKENDTNLDQKINVNSFEGRQKIQKSKEERLTLSKFKTNLSIVITGLGFDADLIKKALTLPPSITLGFANFDANSVALLNNAENSVVIYLPITNNPDLPGVNTKLSQEENEKRIKNLFVNIPKKYINGLYLNVDDTLLSPQIASSVFKIVKDWGIVLFNYKGVNDSLINKLNKSSVKFVNADVSLGYNNGNRSSAILESIADNMNAEKVVVAVPASYENIEVLVEWLAGDYIEKNCHLVDIRAFR